MKIALDLDGVCYEWDRTARYMLREYRGQSQLTEESASWNHIQEHVSKEDWRWLWSDGVDQGLFRYGHMTTGARKGIQELVDDGHKIEIVTHRPKDAIQDTLEWITMFFKDIPLHGLLLLTNGERKVISDADVMIDDKPENIEEWTRGGRDAVIFDRPWNQWVRTWGPATYRARGWADVPLMVRRTESGAAQGRTQS